MLVSVGPGVSANAIAIDKDVGVRATLRRCGNKVKAE